MLKRWFFAVVALAAAQNVADAAQTYTPEQLRRMVASGRYPKQGEIEKTVRTMDYAECIATMETMIGAIKPNYPSVVIVSTNVMRTEKFWTNDGAVTVSCMADGNKLVLIRAPYL